MNFEDYERNGIAAYASLASTVASILSVAIEREGGYRLQQATRRAKSPPSLRKKLQDRQLENTTTLEAEIKDLAGCRLVFYTNGDVTRFINSGVIDENFEVLEAKIHHPQRGGDDATDLYISNHYLVALRPNRLALPEYDSFKGMRCEVQVQTILNHAWAEMAHDTIYKTPELGNFGGKQFDSIKSRLRKVARKYLLPAGYEFQQIAQDFRRLVEGKELFDGDALEAIVHAADNNVRAEALEKFAEGVLPFYDDLNGVFPHVVERLVAAADVARLVPEVAIDTPYGEIQGKTYADIVSAISNILTHCRYIDIETTFHALRMLFSWSSNEAERKPLIDLAKSLAKHQTEVWRLHGPAAQAVLVDCIHRLNDDERRALASVLTAILGEVLGAEITGTSASSDTVTLYSGPVVASNMLHDIRKKAIDLLKHQFELCDEEAGRRDVLLTLQSATRQAIGGAYSKEFALIVMTDTCAIISFEKEVAPKLGLSLRQATETRVYRNYRRFAKLPAALREEQSLVEIQAQIRAAAFSFRDAVNADPDFVDFKTLVGFDCVYPPAWEDDAFQYAEAKAYRTQRVTALLESVSIDNANEWFEKLNRYASIQSDDAATFPVLGEFIAKLSEREPAMVVAFVDKLDGPLERFLPSMLTGLLASAQRAEVLAKIDGWLNEGRHVEAITWHLRFADPFDETLLIRAVQSAIGKGNAIAVSNALLASADQYEKNPGTLIEKCFLPSLGYLSGTDDFGWLHMPWVTWMNSPIIEALEEQPANEVLEVLIPYPNLTGGCEQIVASIAKRWPGSVLNFLGKRQAFKLLGDAPDIYDAVPFDAGFLQGPLAAVPVLVLQEARKWFELDSLHFRFDGARLLVCVFPELGGLSELLSQLIANGREEDLSFALATLSAFEGAEVVYNHVRSVVALIDAKSPLYKKAADVLQESGVVSGAFGFAELHARRKALIEPWLKDENESVREFAAEQIRHLDLLTAVEVRAAETSIAMRKLQYGEELDDVEERG